MHSIPRTLLVLSLFVMLMVISALSSSPPVQTTGAPAIGVTLEEQTCAKSGCHTGGPVNFEGKLEIIGLPETYAPGANYPLTVRLASSQSSATPRWGFQLTCARLSDGAGSGTLSPSGLNMNIVGGRTYISQNVSHLYAGEHGPVEWQVNWTAPDPAEGAVGFYAAGSATDGNFAAGAGDLVYTIAETTQGGFVPVHQVTWGQLKTLSFARR